MANARVKIDGFKVVGYRDNYYKSHSENHYEGNGWEVEILPDGTIHAVASREYSDGTNTVVLTVKRNGFAKFVRITPNRGGYRRETVWRKTVQGWNGTGTIILAGGNIRDRYASVRSKAYTEFLENKGLTQVRFLNSFDELVGTRHQSEYSGAGETWCDIYSDGEVVVNYHDETPENWNSNLHQGFDEIAGVSGATWVIIKEGMHLRDNHNGARTLYLQKGTDLFKVNVPDEEHWEDFYKPSRWVEEEEC